MSAIRTIDLDFVVDDDTADLATVVRAWNASHAPGCGVLLLTAQGPTGWPVVRVGSDNDDAIMDALVTYCGGDTEDALDLFEFVKYA